MGKHRRLYGPSSAGQSTSPQIKLTASNSMRSTVSPLLRHGIVRNVCKDFRPRSRPRRGHVAVERVERPYPRTSPAIALCRLASAPSPRPRGTRTSAAARSTASRPSGGLPKICSPSRICISFRSHSQASSLARRSSSPSFGERPISSPRPESSTRSKDLFGEQLQASRIGAGSFVIFIDQRFQFAQRPMAFGARQRRRQMVDDDRRAAPLGLAALARIVDDERVEMRHRPEHGLGKAGA